MFRNGRGVVLQWPLVATTRRRHKPNTGPPARRPSLAAKPGAGELAGATGAGPPVATTTVRCQAACWRRSWCARASSPGRLSGPAGVAQAECSGRAAGLKRRRRMGAGEWGRRAGGAPGLRPTSWLGATGPGSSFIAGARVHKVGAPGHKLPVARVARESGPASYSAVFQRFGARPMSSGRCSVSLLSVAAGRRRPAPGRPHSALDTAGARPVAASRAHLLCACAGHNGAGWNAEVAAGGRRHADGVGRARAGVSATGRRRAGAPAAPDAPPLWARRRARPGRVGRRAGWPADSI